MESATNKTFAHLIGAAVFVVSIALGKWVGDLAEIIFLALFIALVLAIGVWG